jgi:hypothetical protein
MAFRLLLDVYYCGYIAGQCIPDSTFATLDEIAELIKHRDRGLNWQNCPAIRDAVISASGFNAADAMALARVTARIAQILTVI